MNKRYFQKSLLLLWCLVLFGCHGSQRGWPYVDEETDSINNALDEIYIDHPIKEGLPLIKRLSKKADEQPENKILKAESLYWKALLYRGEQPDSSKLLQAEIRTLLDSTSYPYVMARLDLLGTPHIDKTNFITLHKRLKEIVAYFHEIGDVRMEMMANRHLGTFYVRIGDMAKYKECSEKINGLCEILGNDTLVAKSKLNLALAEIHVGDSARAEKILRELLATPVVKGDSMFISQVYVNLGEVTNDGTYYQKAIDTNRIFREDPGYYNTLRFAMMKKYEQKGNYHKSDSLFALLYPLVKEDGDAAARIFSHQILLRQAEQRGDYPRMLEEKDSIRVISETAFSATQYEQLTSNNYKEELAREELKIQTVKKRAKTTVWIIVLSVLSLLAVLSFLYIRHRKRMVKEKRKHVKRIGEMEKELDKERAQTLAMSQSLAERDRLIKDISEMTENIPEEESGMKENLLKHIKLAQININEWDDFQAAYSKVHPHFLKKLKEEYPDITEGDSRLALYIAAGLSSKEIARVMQLQPDSIKKNRQRLRQRMHIASNEELESVLRNLL